MISILGIVQLGLILALVVHALALCVLFVRVTKLLRLVSIGGGARRLVGFEIPQFQAIDVRADELVSFRKADGTRLCLLVVSSGCQLCQQLLQALRSEKLQFLEESSSLEFIVYCRGSVRGSRTLLMGIESKIKTLVSHDSDIVSILPISSVPALLTTDVSGRVVRHTYPFSIHDIANVVSDLGEDVLTR